MIELNDPFAHYREPLKILKYYTVTNLSEFLRVTFMLFSLKSIKIRLWQRVETRDHFWCNSENKAVLKRLVLP